MSDYNDYKYGWNDKNHFRDNALVHMWNNGGTTKYTLIVPDATIINHVYYV